MRQNMFLLFAIIILILVVLFIGIDNSAVAAPHNKWSSELYTNGLWLYPENQNLAKAYKFERVEGRIKDFTASRETVKVNFYNNQFTDSSAYEFANEFAGDTYINITVDAKENTQTSLSLSHLPEQFIPNTLVNLELVNTDVFSNHFQYLRRLTVYTIIL